MVALGMGIVNVRLAYAQHLCQDDLIIEHCLTQFSPILSLPSCNDVINRCKRKILMDEMSM